MTIPCVWCDATFTNKIALANHFDNVHKGCTCDISSHEDREHRPGCRFYANNQNSLDKILEPFHRHSCRSTQRWIKGMTEPFPCDCDIQDAKAAINKTIMEDLLEMIGENEPLVSNRTIFLGRTDAYPYARNQFRAELRQQLIKKYGGTI